MDKIVSQLTETLKNPENGNRPVQIIHHYFPKTPEEADAYLDRAEEMGMGGFCVNMDDGDGYLRDDSEVWEQLRDFMDRAFARNLQIWIYDERAYPSGAAGDLVLTSLPDAQVKGLFCHCCESAGGEGRMEYPCRYAAAYPVKDGVLLKSRAVPLICENGVIRWNLPEGEWKILAFRTRAVNFLTENKVPYVDLLRKDVTAKFIEVTHERYLRHLGEERIRKVTAFFTDEPGLPVHGCSSYFHETDAVCAWTEEMDQLLPDFEERYVSLFYDTDSGYWESRREWWSTVSRLFRENYFGQIAAWCAAHGTRMTGHLYGEETLSMQTGLNGELFGLLAEMQMPGVDRLYCHDPRDVTAEKTASSAAHLNGHNLVMSENSFHLEYNWWKTPEHATHADRLNSAYYQAQLGVTRPASYFPYPDGDRRDYEIKAARAGTFVSAGRHCAEILVMIPVSEAYARFAVPDHKYWNVGPCIVAPHQGKAVQRLEEVYGTLLETLANGRHDFDLIDEENLARCEIRNGRIETEYESFAELVVPGAEVCSMDALAAIVRFIGSGGHVTFVNAEEPPYRALKWKEQYPDSVSIVCVSEILQTLTVPPELTLTGETEFIRVRKSETDSLELYFIHNRGDAGCTFTVHFEGDFTLCTMDMEITSVLSEGAFEMTIPGKDAMMLIRRKQ